MFSAGPTLLLVNIMVGSASRQIETVSSIEPPDAGAAAPDAAPFPGFLSYLGALAMTGLATLVALALESVATIPNLSLIYVLPVIVAATLSGLWPSMLASVSGALAYNFFFTEPRFSLQVDDAANIWGIGLLFVVGVVVSTVASAAARRRAELDNRKRQERGLRDFGHLVASSLTRDAALGSAAAALQTIFGTPAIILVPDGQQMRAIAERGADSLSVAEIEAARSCFDNGIWIRAGVYPFDESRFDFWPIRSSTAACAVIGLAFDPLERPDEPDVLVELVGQLLGLSLTTSRISGAFRQG
jgi:K+-sensing histidine kinase KdpD